MIKNYAFEKTPKTGEYWKNLSNDERIASVKNELKKDEKLNNFEVYKVSADGQIVLKVNSTIPSSKRGNILLDLEEQLKKNIDNGLTIWFEPVGDKSKLRNLRGIKINQEN
ncbi:hypothetical protein OAT35_01090 [Candidatus Pelagibacter sp.]|nr:hypothetical protein [Candidatus Pelagibacter sp.]